MQPAHRFAGGVRDRELSIEVTSSAPRPDFPFYVCLHMRTPTAANVHEGGRTSALEPGESIVGLPPRYALRLIVALVRGLLRWRPIPFG